MFSGAPFTPCFSGWADGRMVKLACRFTRQGHECQRRRWLFHVKQSTHLPRKRGGEPMSPSFRSVPPTGPFRSQSAIWRQTTRGLKAEAFLRNTSPIYGLETCFTWNTALCGAQDPGQVVGGG